MVSVQLATCLWEIPAFVYHAAGGKVVGASIESPIKACDWQALGGVTILWVLAGHPHKTAVFPPSVVIVLVCVANESIVLLV